MVNVEEEAVGGIWMETREAVGWWVGPLFVRVQPVNPIRSRQSSKQDELARTARVCIRINSERAD